MNKDLSKGDYVLYSWCLINYRWQINDYLGVFYFNNHKNNKLVFDERGI